MIFLLLLAFVPSFSHGADPDPAILGSPAFLLDYQSYARESQRFNERGSPTRAFRDLVEVLYDFDNGRPWGAEYFPEANARLKAFRSVVCPLVPANDPIPVACIRPALLLSGADIQALQAAVLEPVSLHAVEGALSLSIRAWELPGRENGFNLVAGKSSGELRKAIRFWDLSAKEISWEAFTLPLLHDRDSYRAGFEMRDFPALLSYSAGGMVLNDWLLQQRALGFAADWKHAIGANRRWNPKNPIFDSKERLFQALFDAHSADFSRLYAELREKVKSAPEHLARFDKERAEGDYPEEVYQHLAYPELKAILELQGSFLALARAERKSLSPRQQALESLLTVQRYSARPRFFVMELLTLMEPITSHAYALDAAADAFLAQTYVLELLKGLLGLEIYQGEALFPALGASLLHPELFKDSYLEENAPDIKRELAGRDFASLPVREQLRIFGLYLQPAAGKIRPQALFRMAVLWLSGASDEELRRAAEAVHAKRYP